jgi:hypothetical protein
MVRTSVHRYRRAAPSFALFRLRLGASRRDVPVSAVGRDILSAPPCGARPAAQAGLASRLALIAVGRVVSNWQERDLCKQRLLIS